MDFDNLSPSVSSIFHDSGRERPRAAFRSRCRPTCQDGGGRQRPMAAVSGSERFSKSMPGRCRPLSAAVVVIFPRQRPTAAVHQPATPSMRRKAEVMTHAARPLLPYIDPTHYTRRLRSHTLHASCQGRHKGQDDARPGPGSGAHVPLAIPRAHAGLVTAGRDHSSLRPPDRRGAGVLGRYLIMA